MTGWEFPGQTRVEADRRFEVLWTVDSRVVRDAALICTHLAESFSPGLGHLRDVLPTDLPPPASADLKRATGVLNRMTGYLERAAGERTAGERKGAPGPGAGGSPKPPRDQ